MVDKTHRDAELAAQGWSRQFSAGPPRLAEAVEAYEEMGLEVLLEPLGPEIGDGGCASCLSGSSETLKMIYTRPKPVDDIGR